ncbi:MAG TPA: hypothetical protein VE967_15865 [Gemmatimonadaceae bacterium]|nr:hypothetical protein [Gemmatimonadaceae bacterium]
MPIRAGEEAARSTYMRGHWLAIVEGSAGSRRLSDSLLPLTARGVLTA